MSEFTKLVPENTQVTETKKKTLLSDLTKEEQDAVFAVLENACRQRDKLLELKTLVEESMELSKSDRQNTEIVEAVVIDSAEDHDSTSLVDGVKTALNIASGVKSVINNVDSLAPHQIFGDRFKLN
jgi:uncharacterized protein YaaQ